MSQTDIDEEILIARFVETSELLISKYQERFNKKNNEPQEQKIISSKNESIRRIKLEREKYSSFGRSRSFSQRGTTCNISRSSLLDSQENSTEGYHTNRRNRRQLIRGNLSAKSLDADFESRKFNESKRVPSFSRVSLNRQSSFSSMGSSASTRSSYTTRNRIKSSSLSQSNLYRRGSSNSCRSLPILPRNSDNSTDRRKTEDRPLSRRDSAKSLPFGRRLSSESSSSRSRRPSLTKLESENLRESTSLQNLSKLNNKLHKIQRNRLKPGIEMDESGIPLEISNLSISPSLCSTSVSSCCSSRQSSSMKESSSESATTCRSSLGSGNEVVPLAVTQPLFSKPNFYNAENNDTVEKYSSIFQGDDRFEKTSCGLITIAEENPKLRINNKRTNPRRLRRIEPNFKEETKIPQIFEDDKGTFQLIDGLIVMR